MNNAQGSFVHSAIRQNQHPNPKIPIREFIFNDITDKGSFLFKNMKLDLFTSGKWSFYITAEGNHTTTILRNGRNSGPCLFIVFRDNSGNVIGEVGLGQVNYDNDNDSANNYICKGIIPLPESVECIEVRYEAFMDFACRRN